MEKSKLATICTIIVILIYGLLAQTYFVTLGNTYTYIINPLFFIVLAITLKITIMPQYKTDKYKTNIIQYVLIAILSYSLVYLLSGFLVGFGKNPYANSINGLIYNLYSIGLVVFCKEYIRYKLINNIFKKDRQKIYILLIIVFTILDLNIGYFISNISPYFCFKYVFYVILPSIFKNTLFTYLAQYTDYTPAVIYEMVYNIILWMAPVLPKNPWVLDAILNIMFPFVLLLCCKYQINKKERFHLNALRKSIDPSWIIPFGIALVLIIWFALGIFPIKPIAVATGSMIPYLRVGDLVLVKKCDVNEIELQDIIEYQMEDYTVIHRVIEIQKKDGESVFTTKGDNNDSKDSEPVRENQVLGKIIFKVPYIALPSVWIHSMNQQKDIGVKTGE